MRPFPHWWESHLEQSDTFWLFFLLEQSKKKFQKNTRSDIKIQNIESIESTDGIESIECISIESIKSIEWIESIAVFQYNKYDFTVLWDHISKALDINTDSFTEKMFL